MSAFLCNSKTINSIVSHIGYKRNFEYWKEEIKDRLGTDYDVTTEKGRELLGRYMFEMNMEALGLRYGEGQKVADWGTEYKYQLELFDSPIQAMKNLSCYLYQCTEGPKVENSPLYRLLKEIESALYKDFVRDMPEYDQAAWGH